MIYINTFCFVDVNRHLRYVTSVKRIQYITLTSVASIAFLAISAPVFAAGDAEKGAKVWKKCRACHTVGEDAKNKVGPNLNDLLGRQIGSVEDFKYSDEMSTADSAWSEEALDSFLAKPKEMFPKTRMSFRGLKKEKDRANLISFLAQYSEGAPIDGDVVEVKSDPEVSAEILAISGDADYGEYLSGTCVACHQADGTDQGLPSINGWPEKDFVTVLHAYKNKDRENPVMQQLAGALSNDEIASLATYFNQQP